MSTNDELVIMQLKDEVKTYKARLCRLSDVPIPSPIPLSRRDQLAGMAMQGMLSGNPASYFTYQRYDEAVQHADDLIKQLDREQDDA